MLDDGGVIKFENILLNTNIIFVLIKIVVKKSFNP